MSGLVHYSNMEGWSKETSVRQSGSRDFYESVKTFSAGTRKSIFQREQMHALITETVHIINRHIQVFQS